TQEKPKSKRKFVFECEFFRLTQGDVDGIASRYSELRGKTEQLNQFVDWCRANPDKAPKPHSAQAIFRLRKWFAGALDRQKQFDGEDTESGGSRWAC
ncbi:MAG: hypothetical protein MJH10_09435, partial [Epibacterium sp.]|nr:hypothetical protein [Epibacterium sp.]